MERFEERYWKLSEMEERFNSSSAGVRTLASGWVLAAIAAIGWLLEPAKAQNPWAIPVGLLLLLVCTLGSAGIATLWVIDQLVFHRLLISVFLVGLRMEYADHTLPPIRTMMMKTLEGVGTHRWERLFYLAPLVVFVLLSSVIISLGSETLFRSLLPLRDTRSVAYVLVVAQMLMLFFVVRKQSSVGVVKGVASFGDGEFEELVKKGHFEKVLSKWNPVQSTSERSESPDNSRLPDPPKSGNL